MILLQDFALDFLGKQSLATLGLSYAADRKRSERLEMTVTLTSSQSCSILISWRTPNRSRSRAVICRLPLIDLLNWDTVGMGGAVSQGQIIFPSNPLVPGQTSAQIALNTATLAMESPIFSNIAGQTTVDGSVTWVSLGVSAPPEGAQDWVRLAPVPLGTLVLPKPVSGAPDLESIQDPGKLNYPPTGVAVPIYSIFSSDFRWSGRAMRECTSSGLLGGLSTARRLHSTLSQIHPAGPCISQFRPARPVSST